MRTITKTIYVAFDGKEFNSAAECKAHDRNNAGAALVKLTEDQITAAIHGDDIHLGEAIERVAYLIAQERKRRGNFKRQRSSVTQTDDA